jgi:hypothetical protein
MFNYNIKTSAQLQYKYLCSITITTHLLNYNINISTQYNINNMFNYNINTSAQIQYKYICSIAKYIYLLNYNKNISGQIQYKYIYSVRI